MTAYYSNWKSDQYKCPSCGWVGLGAELEQGELFEALFETNCPRCHGRISAVMLPTLEESRANWEKLSSEEKLSVDVRDAFLKNCESRKLASADQLPDLSGDDLILVWDIESRQGGDTLIRFGDLVVWREPALFEGYERYIQVANLFAERYGDRFQDLVPSRKSTLFLYGDALAAPGIVDTYRKQRS